MNLSKNIFTLSSLLLLTTACQPPGGITIHKEGKFMANGNVGTVITDSERYELCISVQFNQSVSEYSYDGNSFRNDSANLKTACSRLVTDSAGNFEIYFPYRFSIKLAKGEQERDLKVVGFRAYAQHNEDNRGGSISSIKTEADTTGFRQNGNRYSVGLKLILNNGPKGTKNSANVIINQH